MLPRLKGVLLSSPRMLSCLLEDFNKHDDWLEQEDCPHATQWASLHSDCLPVDFLPVRLCYRGWELAPDRKRDSAVSSPQISRR